MKATRRFFIRGLSTIGLGSLLPGLAKAQNSIEGNFVHMVFFWLKDPEKTLKSFIKGTEAFVKKVETVKMYHIGTPANTPRELVDNSYSCCLVVTFQNKADHDIYQKHKAHLDYIEERKDQWERVQVYDSLS